VTFPTYSDDFFSEEFMLDPHPHYRAMRDLGPVVHLESCDVLALSRFDDVKAALVDHETFISGKGTALDDNINELIKGGTIVSDGETHARQKRVTLTALSAKAMQSCHEQLQTAANEIVDMLLERGTCNLTELTHHLPVAVISSLVGLPEGGREKMLDWSHAAFNSFGPMNERALATIGDAAGQVEYAMSITDRSVVTPGSFADHVFDCADNGEIEREKIPNMLLDFITPSLDTTIHGMGWLLYYLAQSPQSWAEIRADRSLIPNASQEALRMEAPIRFFSRVTSRDADVSGVTIPADTRVMTVFSSANRDERYFDSPDTFDIHRSNASHQLSFGFGKHICSGRHLALLEMQCILDAMADRITTIEGSEMKLGMNNCLYGIESMELAFT
jgi:cytochrome P450